MGTKNQQQERSVELRYGIQVGKVVHISDVDSGLACDCFCPGCQAPLVARKGEVRTHHFAHHKGVDSEACIETALHRYAKQVIQEHKAVLIPTDELKAVAIDKQGKTHVRQLKILGQRIEFEKVDLEVFINGYRSDATGYPYENRTLDIEVCVSHKVDDDKQSKALAAEACMMEIDLSQLARDASPEEVAQAVLSTAPRHWISNPVHQQVLANLQIEVDQLALEADRAAEAAREANKALKRQTVQPPSLTPENPDNHMLLGFKVGHGYSPRYRNDFELSKLYTTRPVLAHSTRNFTSTQSGGFEMEEIDLDESCIQKLKELEYPVEASLIMGTKINGRRFIPVVLDVRVE